MTKREMLIFIHDDKDGKTKPILD